MKLVMKARGMKMTSAIRSYIQTKIAEPTSRLCDSPAAKLEVRVGVGKAGASCDIHFLMPRMAPIVVSVTTADLYDAIDYVHDRLLKQVKRYRAIPWSLMRRRSSRVADRQGVATLERVGKTFYPLMPGFWPRGALA